MLLLFAGGVMNLAVIAALTLAPAGLVEPVRIAVGRLVSVVAGPLLAGLPYDDGRREVAPSGSELGGGAVSRGGRSVIEVFPPESR